MAREKLVFENGKFVPLQREERQRHTVITDEMPALKHPANGQFYTSRKKYDEVTRAYGYEECYGEPDKYFERQVDEEAYEKEIEEDIIAAELAVDYGESLNEEQRALARIINEREEWEAQN